MIQKINIAHMSKNNHNLGIVENYISTSVESIEEMKLSWYSLLQLLNVKNVNISVYASFPSSQDNPVLLNSTIIIWFDL